MKRLFFFTISIILFLHSCSNYSQSDIDRLNQQHQEEIDLKNKELELKAKELELKELELQTLNENNPKELSEHYLEVKKSVYLVYTQNYEGVAQGSAFLISPDGLAISNYHLFENASDAILFNDQNKEFLITEIIGYSSDKDYIIFKIGTTRNDLDYLNISNETPKVGEECFTVGNPQGLTQTLSKGIISAFRENEKYIQAEVGITHGSSGAPLFNRNGEVIGITTGGFGKAASLNYAINIKELPLSNLTIRNTISQSTFSKEDVKQLVEDYYTFLIDNNFVQLENMYANNLKRYFDKFNIRKSEAISKAKDYDSKFGVISKIVSVRWDTLKIEKDGQGNINARYIIDYSLKRSNSNKVNKYVINMIIEIDSQGKIYSIYENILQRNYTTPHL